MSVYGISYFFIKRYRVARSRPTPGFHSNVGRPVLVCVAHQAGQHADEGVGGSGDGGLDRHHRHPDTPRNAAVRGHGNGHRVGHDDLNHTDEAERVERVGDQRGEIEGEKVSRI